MKRKSFIPGLYQGRTMNFPRGVERLLLNFSFPFFTPFVGLFSLRPVVTKDCRVCPGSL